MENFDCLVVGAGVSGLVAAEHMARNGRRVRVLEAAPHVGGCVRSWRPQGQYWQELGAHTAYNSYAPLLEVLAARGRLQDLLLRNKAGYRFRLASGRLQSPLARIHFLEALVALPFGLGRPKTGQTVAQWFGRLLGRHNYRQVLAPAFAAVLSQPADNFPAEWLFRRKPRMQSAPRKFSFSGGLQGLLEALLEAAPFELQTGVSVQGVRRVAEGFIVQTDEAELACRQLIVATPVDTAAQLLADAYPEAARILRGFPMSSSEALGVVVMAERVAALPRIAGLIGTEGDFWSVVTRDPVPDPSWRGFTFHFRAGALNRAEKLARAAHVLGVSVTDFLHVAEVTNRLPAPGVDHPRRVLELDALLVHEPVALVGNYLNGLSIGDCAERAVAEAQRLRGER